MDDPRFRLIAEYDRDVLILSRGHEVEFISPGVVQAAGWDPAALVGRPFLELVHPDDRDDFVARRDRIEHGADAEMRCRIRHADGTYHWWDARARGVPDPDGAYRGRAVSSWRLVDHDMAVLAELSKREKWLELVAEHSSDVVVLLREDGEVEWMSRAVGHRGAINLESVGGSAPWHLIHEDDRDEALATFANAVRERTAAEMTLRFEEAPGTFHWLAVTARPLDDPSLPGRMVVSFRDVEDEHTALELLAASERRYRTLAENATDVVYSLDADGVVTWISPSVEEIFGWRPSDVVGRAVAAFLHPEDLAVLAAHAPERRALVLDGAEGGQVVIRFRDSAGGWRWVGLTGRAIRDDEGAVLGGIESLRDISAEMAARDALADSERQFRLAMHGSPDGMAVLGLDRRFLSVNPALSRALGRDAAWFVDRSIDDIVHVDDRDDDHAVRTRLLAGEAEIEAQERRLVAADGATRWVLHSVGLLRDHDERPLFFVSHFQDITARKDVEANLAFAATHDPLTGLSNRTDLVAEIRRSLSVSNRSHRPTAVILLDLDHFKFVNDSLGHATGDELIREAARRITSTVRDSDLVARHGGDEFVVVMRDLEDPTEAVRVAQRLVESFRLPMVVNRTELFTTASVGVSISREESDVDALLAEADAAMYVAKDEGRDRLSLFNDELRAAITERLRVENGLRHALERDEFEVWFQPEVDLASGELTAVEALLRWRRPDGGLHSADRFIGVAEESGLIVDIGRTVIRRAFAHAALWNAARPSRRCGVRVNLSPRQLAEPDLLQVVDEALRSSGADPSLLCFEITETAILRDTPAVRTNLQGIQDRGIALAVDDFGTGYASLTYLRQLPISVLKLDRSFVAGVADCEADRQLVAGVIGLAKNLGITVTAEGVEHPAQAAVLRRLGCPRAQGFLYSAAVMAGTIDVMLAAEDMMFAGVRPASG